MNIWETIARAHHYYLVFSHSRPCWDHSTKDCPCCGPGWICAWHNYPVENLNCVGGE